jgi:hypothetical protein
MFGHDEHARKGCQMGFKVSLIAGFALGYVVGAAAGRERYEQMKKVATQAVQSPPVQKAAQTAGQKASELGKAAKDKAATQMPKLTETAKNSATKVRGQFDRLPGRHAADSGAESEAAAVNGTRPAD